MGPLWSFGVQRVEISAPGHIKEALMDPLTRQAGECAEK